MIKYNLILLLAERQLKVADAVLQTGISKTTLHKIYKDESTQIDFETIDKLCDFLGITMGEFLNMCQMHLRNIRT